MPCIKFVLIFSFLFIKQNVFCQIDEVIRDRIKRAVPPIVFPPTAPTRVQLIFGIGIPEEDLAFESLTSGWVLKYEYFLPSNVTQLYVPDRLNIAGRSIQDESSNNEKYNAEVVEIETGLNGVHLDINTNNDFDEIETNLESLSEEREYNQQYLSKYRWAVYRALEAAADRKGLGGRTCVLKSICEAAETSFHYYNGILAELLHIILTPSASVDKLSSHSDNEYFHAEELGKSGAPCDLVFKNCKTSLMDIFSEVSDF